MQKININLEFLQKNLMLIAIYGSIATILLIPYLLLNFNTININTLLHNNNSTTFIAPQFFFTIFEWTSFILVFFTCILALLNYSQTRNFVEISIAFALLYSATFDMYFALRIDFLLELLLYNKPIKIEYVFTFFESLILLFCTILPIVYNKNQNKKNILHIFLFLSLFMLIGTLTLYFLPIFVEFDWIDHYNLSTLLVVVALVVSLTSKLSTANDFQKSLPWLFVLILISRIQHTYSQSNEYIIWQLYAHLFKTLAYSIPLFIFVQRIHLIIVEKKIFDRKYKDIEDTLNDIAIISEADPNGNIIFANEQFLKISGYTWSELKGRNHNILRSHEHKDDFFKNLWDTINAKKIWRNEVKNRRKDGSYYWVDSTIYPRLDEHGNISKFVSIRFDITAQKKQKLNLMQKQIEQQILNEILNILTVDMIDEITFISHTLGLLKNLDWITYKGSTAFLSYQDKNFILELANNIDAKALKTLSPSECEYLSMHGVSIQKNDTFKIIEMESLNKKSYFYCPIYRKGVLFGSIIIFTDHLEDAPETKLNFVESLIKTLELKLEQYQFEKDLIISRDKAKAAEKAKSLFLANMSHEIRTPLNGVLGVLNLFKETEMTDKQLEFIEMMQTSGESLLSVVNDILDYSKIEAGKISIEKIDFDFIKMILQLISIYQINTNAKKIQLVNIIDENIPQFIVGDITRIKQILMNLLSNAIKFTHTGSITLHTSLQHESIIFKVADTGIGIAAENVGKLFKSFVQEDSSTTRKYGGTGLGLSISQKLATLMKGEILVESQIGVGTTFTVKIPYEPSKLQNNIEPNEIKIIESNKIFAQNFEHQILIAEDNLINQKLINLILKKMGYQPDFANNGKEAVEMIAQNPQKYSLIFMDMQMPEMDGVEASKKIIKQHKCNAPLIAGLTANVMKEDIDACLNAGMFKVITKPLQEHELKEVLVMAYQMRKAS